MDNSTSSQLFDRACAVIPGGVNSPVRACHNVDSLPLFIAEAHGSHIIDVDGREYIDFISYDPRMSGIIHMKVLRLKADPDAFSTLQDRITLAEQRLESIVSEITRMGIEQLKKYQESC